MRPRLVISLACASALFLGSSGPAHGENIVPNPSFETGCSNTPFDTPDSWTTTGAAAISCSLTPAPGAGSFALLVTVTEDFAGGINEATSCVNRSLSGDYAASYAYSAGSGVDAVSFQALFYADPNCTGTQTIDGSLDGTLTTGSFETVPSTMSAPAGTDSVRFRVVVGCPSTGGGPCGEPASAIFDALVFDVPTTAATFRGLSARTTANGVLLRWRTASEPGVLGFHVYREVNGKRVRVNRTLIAARGGGNYSYLHRGVRAKLPARYWIRVLDLDGSSTWHGPARVRST